MSARPVVSPTARELLDREVSGSAILDDTARFMGRYLHLPTEHALTVLALWAAHTHASTTFYVTPRLVLDSPEPGSGKTRVLELLALLSHNAKLTLSTTTAALYRRIAAAEGDPPTILQDEADAIWGKNAGTQAEDLRALYNAGYKAGATVDRCEGDAKNMRVVEFPVFAPVALAGLAGKMPATITTRAVTIHMRRRRADEHVAEYRERDAAAAAAPLRARLAAWIDEHRADLADARPAMPKGVRDRPAEVWEALLAVADLAGHDWPDKARAACSHFVLDAEPGLSIGQRLLADVRTVFGDREAMFSAELVAALTADEDSEWTDLWGKPLDQRRLAKELRRYGVKPDSMRTGYSSTTKKGYQVDGPTGLRQAWERYLPAENPSSTGTSGTSGTSQVTAVPDENRVRNNRNSVPDVRNKRNTSGTAEHASDLGKQLLVPDVPDVPVLDGSRVMSGHCASCGAPMSLPADIAEGRHAACEGAR